MKPVHCDTTDIEKLTTATDERITYDWLRSVGFRLSHYNLSSTPMMAIEVSSRDESYLELTPCTEDTIPPRWFCWLRNDASSMRCRFVHVRYMTARSQVHKLYEAITDKYLATSPFDADKFHEILERERGECERRFREYCAGERVRR